ncbi:MAG: response regulator, partial [Desulfocapsaceae bacterium]|nr:response regulator [Desulfocapsaceae bacterium]
MIRKVLFVDDDQILQRAVGKQFEVHGGQFELVFADDGFDAVKKLEKFSVSLICTDLMMPRMDGASLLAHVRENYPDIPAIIISELSNDQVEHLITADGIVGYFKKPFQAGRLVPKILEILQDEANGGIMHTISPTTFIQLMEMEGKTCTIRMLDNHSVEGAILYLKDGMLLDARV